MIDGIAPCRIGAAILAMAALSACGGTPAPAPRSAPPPAPIAEAVKAPVELAPLPFTAAQIRDATRNGRRYTFRIEVPGEPTVIEHITFFRVNAEGASLSIGGTSSDGKAFGTSPDRVTWEDLSRHGAFPKAATSIAEETVEVPAGKFACAVYTVHKPDGTVARYAFAKDLPGAPVLYTADKDKKRIRTSTLIEHVPGKE